MPKICITFGVFILKNFKKNFKEIKKKMYLKLIFIGMVAFNVIKLYVLYSGVG